MARNRHTHHLPDGPVHRAGPVGGPGYGGTEGRRGRRRSGLLGIGPSRDRSPRKRAAVVFSGVVALVIATVGPVYAYTDYFHSGRHHTNTAARPGDHVVNDADNVQPVTAAPTPTVTPTPSPTATATSTATSTPTSTPTATHPESTAAAPAPTAGSGGGGGSASGGSIPSSFPSAATTGVPAGTALTPHSGDISIHDDGTVINGWDLQGSLDIYANNVTIENSRISSTNWWGVNLRQGATGLRVLHSTITGVPGKGQDNGGEDYAVSNMSSGSLEVGYNNISEYGDALSTGHGNIHDNYVHDLQSFRNLSNQMQHTDDVISDGSDTGGLVIRHNTLLNQMTTDQGASASVGLFDDDGPVSNTTVDGNFIAGGSYAVYCGGPGSTGIKVTNNVFSTQFWSGSGFYGPVADFNSGGSGNVWSNNVYGGGSGAGRQILPNSG